MEKEFVPYEQALALKGLGFYEQCLGCYIIDKTKDGDKSHFRIFNQDVHCQVLAPLYQQAFRWFRNKHNMLATIYSNASGWCFEYNDNKGGTHRYDSGYTGDCEMSGTFTTYEKAELTCIKILIEIVKNENTN